MNMRNIPLCIPCIGQAEKDAVIEAIKSGWMSHGPYNIKFEEDFAKYLGVKHAIPKSRLFSFRKIVTGEQKVIAPEEKCTLL